MLNGRSNNILNQNWIRFPFLNREKIDVSHFNFYFDFPQLTELYQSEIKTHITSQHRTTPKTKTKLHHPN